MQTTWLGNGRLGDAREQLTIRIRTQGAAPQPTDIADIIHDPLAAAEAEDGDVVSFVDAAPALASHRVSEFLLGPPVRPRKILCVGRNYRAHAEELGNDVPSEPQLFLKPASALVGSGGFIEIPPGEARVDMESELVAMIGRRGRSITARDALLHVGGYTLGNDVSHREFQRGDKQWTRGKGFDTFAPLGPWVRLTEPGFRLPDASRIQGRLDGELRQDDAISLMVFDLATVIEHISACMTLEIGDVIYTGTPAGVAQLRPGQRVEIRLDGFDLGTLVNLTR